MIKGPDNCNMHTETNSCFVSVSYRIRGEESAFASLLPTRVATD